MNVFNCPCNTREWKAVVEGGGGVGHVAGWAPPHRLLLIVMADEIEIGRGGTKTRT